MLKQRVLQPQRDNTKEIPQTNARLSDRLDLLYNLTNYIKSYQFVTLLSYNPFVASIFPKTNGVS